MPAVEERTTSLGRAWMVVPLLLLLVVGIGVPFLQAAGLRPAATEARQARRALERAALDPAALGAAVALGGDADALRALHAAWQATGTEPDRGEALERYLDAVEEDLRAYGVRGMPATDRTRASIDELRVALAAYEAKRAAYEAQRRSLSGCLAIGVSPP